MIRVAGAQIPVTKYYKQNIKTITDAIDWASNNSIDFLVFPEGALSGYLQPYSEIIKTDWDIILQEIVSYAASFNIAIGLPILYPETVSFGNVKTSQIRYYSDIGEYLGNYKKQMVIPADEAYPGDGPNIITFEGISKKGRFNYTVGSFICNDLWGELNQRVIANQNLQHYMNNNVSLIVHPTNGFRSDTAGDELGNQKIKEYADIHLWMASRYTIPILTVDSCNAIEGTYYSGETSSSSGIIHNGEWLVKSNSQELDYFYYDLNLGQ